MMVALRVASPSNGYRARAWKLELQDLADEANICIIICHFPPGTSKWNKIEHRLFCHITQNWRGRPLVTYETVVNLIGNTRTISGVRVKARLDQHHYPTGEKISLAEMKHLAINQARFHDDWNYTINPQPK